jgi:uncharacterized metal-binding protein YceD (DUF177 family)
MCFPIVLFQEGIEAHSVLLQHHLTLPQRVLCKKGKKGQEGQEGQEGKQGKQGKEGKEGKEG